MIRKIYIFLLIILITGCSGRPTVNIYFNKTSNPVTLREIADIVIKETDLSIIDKSGDYVDPKDVMIWMYSFTPINMKSVITGSNGSKPFISIYTEPDDELTNELLLTYVENLNKLEIGFKVNVLRKDYYFSVSEKKLKRK